MYAVYAGEANVGHFVASDPVEHQQEAKQVLPEREEGCPPPFPRHETPSLLCSRLEQCPDEHLVKNVASKRLCCMTLIGCRMWVRLRLEQKRYYYLDFFKTVAVSIFGVFFFSFSLFIVHFHFFFSELLCICLVIVR
jgi:hypothetical protein